MPRTKPTAQLSGRSFRNLVRKAGRNFSSKHPVFHSLIYVAAFIALIIMSLAGDRSSTPANSEEEGYARFLSSDFWYEQILGKPRSPAQHVAVIVVGKDIPSIVHDEIHSKLSNVSPACNRRIYLADLLRAVSYLSPKVVVLDMWFDPQFCSPADSQPLWDSLNQLSTQVPVVDGIGSYSLFEIRSAWPAELADMSRRGLDLKPTELVLIRSSRPPYIENAKISEGVVELDSNPRRIPLSWPVYDSFEAGRPGSLRRLDSLSIASVRAFDPNSAVLSRIGALAPDGSATASVELPPYTTLLREADLPITRATDIICSSPRDHFWETACQSVGPPRPPQDFALAGRVVLIGQVGTGGDVHDSPIGNIPGVTLQAEYIESLLQNRAYKSIPVFYQVAVGFVWLIAIARICESLFNDPQWAQLLYLLGILFIPVYLIRFFFIHFKYYTEFLIPPFLAVLVVVATKLIEHFLSPREETP